MRFPVLDPLDRRLNAYRPDLADTRLAGRIEADRFVEGETSWIAAPVADLRREPDRDTVIEHQLLLGEEVRMFERRDGWAWLQCQRDRYVGWTREENLSPDIKPPTHVVRAPRTFVYPGPDLKLPVRHALSMGSFIRPLGRAETRGTKYLTLENGDAIIARHARPVRENDDDYVGVARDFLRTPYLWGGSSGFGLDCSGIVELSMRMCGKQVLRDSDMQAATLGKPVDPGPDLADLIRGDLIFWRGHVAIVEGDGNLLHANGYTMDVTSEPLFQALGRIGAMFEEPVGFRRP